MTRPDPTDLLDTVAITVTRRAAETLDACIDAMLVPELAPTGRIEMRSAIILDAADTIDETLRGLG